jgi:hypothetical protein
MLLARRLARLGAVPSLSRLPWEPQPLARLGLRLLASAPPPGGSPGPGSPGGAAGTPPSSSGLLSYLRAKKAEFQALIVRYGWFTGFTYFGVYLVTLGTVYGAVRVGLLPVPDVNAVVNDLSAKKFVMGPEPVNIPPQWRDFATAWLVTKTTEPLRLVATIVIVPLLARRLPPGVLTMLGVKAKNLP